MQNLSICRICLATNLRLCYNIARRLQDMYEKLTNLTFKREDRRPVVACYICHARLENCYRLRTSCLQSEELLTEMLSKNELVPQSVSSTNTLRVVSVLHFSLGHALPYSTKCPVKEEAPEVTHDAELDQQNTEDIKMESQELDTQIDNNKHCSHLNGPLERDSDDVETDAEDIKLVMNNITIEENEPNGASQSSPSAYNLCPKIVKVVLDRRALYDTILATGVPALKKLAETDSLLVTKPKDVNKSIIIDKLVVTAHDEGNQASKNNISSIKKCPKSKSHLESHTRSKHDLTRPKYTHTGKQFSRKSQLRVHLARHTGDKQFQCDTCNKFFKSKSFLTRHIYTHACEKRLQCDICKKCFKFKCHLTPRLSATSRRSRLKYP